MRYSMHLITHLQPQKHGQVPWWPVLYGVQKLGPLFVILLTSCLKVLSVHGRLSRIVLLMLYN